jgi:protein-tyrosine phosphatase
MIDLHCHILPAMDDGADSKEESLAMARLAAADGIRTIVATPHVKHDIPDPARIHAEVTILNRRLEEQDIPLEVVSGGDVSALLPVEVVRNYTVNGTDFILLEFPHSHLPHQAEEILFQWQLAGLRPIITHPERNPSILRDPGHLARLIDAGALVQVTGGSLTGQFGIDVRNCACHLVAAGMVHFLASDGHSSRYRRPELSAAVRMAADMIGDHAARTLVEDNPAAVLSGRGIDA